jgi:hypothetical protein
MPLFQVGSGGMNETFRVSGESDFFHKLFHLFPRRSLWAAPPVSYKKMGPPMIRYQ